MLPAWRLPAQGWRCGSRAARRARRQAQRRRATALAGSSPAMPSMAGALEMLPPLLWLLFLPKYGPRFNTQHMYLRASTAPHMA